MRRRIPETKCDRVAEQLSAYIDGDLRAERCAEIGAHARTCRRCARVIADLRKTTGLCQRAATKPLPEAVRDRARVRIRALIARGKLTSFPPGSSSPD